MTPGPGIVPGTHWWKASTLTTAPNLQIFNIPFKVAPYKFYDRTCAEDEISSNLRALIGKRQCFSMFYFVNTSTKCKTDDEFSRVSFGEIP